MKALVFGGGGQLGRALVASNPQMQGLSRSDCDITDEAAVRAAISQSGHDVIINAAAYTAVDKAENEAELAHRINGEAPGWMASGCAASGKKFAHISTDFIFGTGHGSPIAADAAPAPMSVYGHSKLAGERAVQAALPDALIIRTSWVYAAVGANFVRTMLRLMAQRDEISVVADQIGSPTNAADLAGAVTGLIAADARGIYHFTNSGAASWYDFAVAIAEEGHAAGLLQKIPHIIPIPTSAYPTPASRPAYSVLEKQATWDALGRHARHWRAALRTAISEIQTHG
jgi:dTDP-4-dehydrorhamnose reductase